MGYLSFGGAVAQEPRADTAVVPVDVVIAQKRKFRASICLARDADRERGGQDQDRQRDRWRSFRDGATVRQGDLLFTMDGRCIEAQIHQVEGQLARDKASSKVPSAT
jgi:hypothetical protein